MQIPARVFRARFTGLLFDTDKTFLLPSALNGLPALRRLFEQHPGVQVLVVGHTDTAGSPTHNLTLSQERALSIAAFLRDDVDFWLQFYQGRPGSTAWGSHEDGLMLGRLGFASVRDFQTAEGLAADGSAGPNTRRALVSRYMAEDGTVVPAGTVLQTHGCGEFHPDVPTADSTPLQANRRVELFFFEDAIAPPPRDPCPAPGCPEYEKWRTATRRTIDLDDATGALTVTVVEESGGPIAGAAVELAGPVADEATTVEAGTVRFDALLPGTYTVRARKDGFQDGASTVAVRAGADGAALGEAGGGDATTIALAEGAGDLRIQVNTSSDRPLAGATVQLDGPSGPQTLVTDAAGVIDLAGIDSGSYTLVASKPNFDTSPVNTVVVPVSGSIAHTITLTSQVQWQIRVTDAPSTSPIGGAAVQAAGPDVVSGTTAADGTVFFEGIPAGSYTVTVLPGNGINADATQTVAVALGSLVTSIALAQLPTTNALVTAALPVVLVKKANCTPRRVQVTLRTSIAFAGTGTFTRSDPRIKFFTAAAAGTEIFTVAGDNVFTGAALSTPAGVAVFAEGFTVSGGLNDTALTLTLTGGVGPVSAGSTQMTSVELTVEICQSRTAAAGDPALMTAANRAARGRFLHIQDPGRHQGRAMIVVRRAAPAAFTGDLVLTALAAGAGRVALLAGETPPVPPAAADAPVALPFVVTNATLAAAPAVLGSPGLKFFVEGTTVSGALRDTGFQIGLSGGDPDGDRVPVTIVRFTNLRAEVRSTQANTPRAPAFTNTPVPASVLLHASAAAIAAADFDEDYTVNIPLVLVEDSVQAANRIQLGVRVAPANVPVSWSILRDTRPAPNGDGAKVRAIHPALPTLVAAAAATVPAAATPLTATLLADGVGSFRVRAFVDENASAAFERDAAAAVSFSPEPFILMNLVLIRVQGFANTSIGQSGNVTLVPAAPTGATGVRVVTGNFLAGGSAGSHEQADIDVIGGGPAGLRGLDALFGGWVNQVAATPGSASVPAGLDIFARYQFNPPPPPPPPAPAPPPPPPAAVFRRSFMIFSNDNPAAGGITFLPADAAPAIMPLPILDSAGGFRNPNQGTGGDTPTSTRSAGPPATVKIARPAIPGDPTPPGQRWTLEMWDSPAFTFGPAHPGALPGNLVLARFNLNFRTDLVFWTNNVTPANSQPTPGPVNAPAAAAPDPACCLYSSVQTNNWTIRFEMTFAPAAPFAAVESVLRNVTVNRDASATRRATPVEGSGLEVRFPTALGVLRLDATA